jgi:uncharacterized lipoprotein YddW (UPF0748 family)
MIPGFFGRKQGFTNIHDWRRDNVSKLIKSVSEAINSARPDVQFGISPFGVWRNKDKDPDGSDTRAGITCYDDSYADVLLWLKKDWIDYVAPQLYWSIGYQPADFRVLLEWWVKKTKGEKLYIGHAAYKVNSAVNDPNWKDPGEIFVKSGLYGQIREPVAVFFLPENTVKKRTWFQRITGSRPLQVSGKLARSGGRFTRQNRQGYPLTCTGYVVALQYHVG